MGEGGEGRGVFETRVFHLELEALCKHVNFHFFI